MRPNVNSFVAGFASALLVVVIGNALIPAVRLWWQSVKGAGGMGMILVVIAVALGAWALGRTQTDGGPGPGGGPTPQRPPHSDVPPQDSAPPPQSGVPPHGGYPGAGQHQSNGYANGSAHMPSGNTGGENTGPPPKTWQRTNPAPGPADAGPGSSPGAAGTAKGAWEKAREETKRKEEERKSKEADRKRKEELDKKLKEARERDAREREAREKVVREREAQAKEKLHKEQLQKELDRLKREKELNELKERLAKERLAKERIAKEKLAQEKLAQEKLAQEKLAKEKLAKEKLAKESTENKENEGKPKGSTYAFSAVGEKTNPWPQGKHPAARSQPSSQGNSPSKARPPPAPSARTYQETEDDQHSFRPYDKPKKPSHTKAPSSVYSASSYAASQSTYATTAPPTSRGPYTSKDPDKIVIKAVYAFNNAFLKTPTSQLVSGVGFVTDGLILRITTEGLFIDDDVRGVPQREWDVKAWTMKLVEVWCPCFRQGPAGTPASSTSAAKSPLRRLWGLDKDKPATTEEIDALLSSMLSLCKNTCRLGSSVRDVFDDDRRSSASDSAYGSSVGTNEYQTGENKGAHLHILRASIRDQEGKRYVFVIHEEESWKVAMGLQRLRKGTQVRALGVSGMNSSDAKHTLDNLGWI
ncbi:putative reticulocyte-binding protein 2 like protein a [Calycina marina]|uniref:Reticulocyte-binding protein 2 like protein a n=1 Tax=Calycina marina TaxID=1763456 RepID=A0A9P7Z930_9HELO|nr:putative reticulocyte-binding protein 2 like protein a [Calycina marina]